VGDEDYIDYVMCKEFGLDWKEYDCKRMTKFIHIIKFEREAQKPPEKDKPKFRPRNK